MSLYKNYYSDLLEYTNDYIVETLQDTQKDTQIFLLTLLNKYFLDVLISNKTLEFYKYKETVKAVKQKFSKQHIDKLNIPDVFQYIHNKYVN